MAAIKTVSEVIHEWLSIYLAHQLDKVLQPEIAEPEVIPKPIIEPIQKPDKNDPFYLPTQPKINPTPKGFNIKSKLIFV